MAALIGPLLATITTFGFLFVCNYSYTEFLATVPFLVLVIGGLPTGSDRLSNAIVY